uniref:Ras-related protein Rab-7b n=1 Tax=Parastrongyloides trichosuri TaxID=131310 RepID=A0A0N4ZWN7_PARTI
MDKLHLSLMKPVIKIVVLGDSGVGKTAIMNRFAENYYSDCYKSTIGADFRSKDVTIDGVSVTLQIWDTAGQERYKSLGVAFYRGADCCILVYDVTNSKSFSRIEYWKEEFLFQSNPFTFNNFPFIVVGNKIDKGIRTVKDDKIQSWMEKNNIPHFVVSAKDDYNIQEIFHFIPKITNLKNTKNIDIFNEQTTSVTISKKNKNKSNGKCSC